jgi:tetratricopeptide (TPR) repeat protein
MTRRLESASAFGSVRPHVVGSPASRALLFAAMLGVSACAGTESESRKVAVVRQESSAKVLFEKGRASAAVGDLTRAEQYFVASLKAGGNDKQIIKPLLIVCITDQRLPVALDYAEQYLYRHPKDLEVLFVTASIHAGLGNVKRARELFEVVARERPQSAEAHYALATVLREEGGWSRADRHDLEYLRLDPNGKYAEQARARLTEGAR